MSDSQPHDGEGWQLEDLDPEEHGNSVVGGEEVAHTAEFGKPELHQPEPGRRIPTMAAAFERLKRPRIELREK